MIGTLVVVKEKSEGNHRTRNDWETSTLLVKYYRALLSVFMSVILFGFLKS